MTCCDGAMVIRFSTVLALGYAREGDPDEAPEGALAFAKDLDPGL
ncbi:MAG TPA: hypothetical protein VI248_07965 [Kineosporiaceae bacterium]